MKHFSKFFSEYHLPPSLEDSTPKRTRACTSSEKSSNESIDRELTKINSFIRSGLFVLSVILISSIAIAYGQKNLTGSYTATSGNRISNKKLPIYCVEQQNKKVALSFDAAWGKSRLMSPARYAGKPVTLI